MKKTILVILIVIVTVTISLILYFSNQKKVKLTTVVEYTAMQKEEFIQSQIKFVKDNPTLQLSGDISKTVKYVEENKGFTDIIKRPDGKLAILFTIGDNPTSFEIHTCSNLDCSSITEKLDGVMFYEGREKAKIFFYQTDYDKIPKYAGTRESGAKYERYSITRLSDIIAKQQAQVDKKKRDDLACKGDSIIIEYVADAKIYKLKDDPTFKPTMPYTFDEFSVCWTQYKSPPEYLDNSQDPRKPENEILARGFKDALQVYMSKVK